MNYMNLIQDDLYNLDDCEDEGPKEKTSEVVRESPAEAFTDGKAEGLTEVAEVPHACRAGYYELAESQTELTVPEHTKEHQ